MALPSTDDRTAAAPGPRDPPTRERWSLERRLPLLISVLLACVVGGLSVAAYREVRGATLSRAGERLQRGGRELVAAAARGTALRSVVLQRLAGDPRLARAVLDDSVPAPLAAWLDSLHIPGDSLRDGWELAAADGRTVGASAGGWSATDSLHLAPVRAAAARTGAEQRSPLYAFGERAHGWAVVPVRSGGRVVGTVAQLLRVGDNPAIERLVRALIDDDARVLFTSLGTTQWITSRGHPAPAPFTAPAEDGRARHVGTGDDESIAAAYTLAPSPWRIVLYQTTDSVLRRPYQFLRRILVAGLLALAVAGAGAWLLGRHLTRPLREVTDAAAALSRGDYSRRVRVTGGGLEVETLASTFNAMAARIGDAHDALAERNAELQRANAAKAQFLAMMSHELRTPLNAIGGFTELLELGLRGPVTAEQIEDLGRIRRNKDLLLAIISDILEFSRADAGALAVARETLRIAPLLRGVTEMVGPQMVAKGVRLVCPPVAEDLVALGDRERVQQVVLNLLSNAIKFTEPGGEVVVDTAALDGEVRIAVRDTGAGIHADQLETIFEPFVQLDASLTRRAGGTGLGLAISRQLAHAMGGTLSVESTVGVGSTFTLSLASGTPKHGGAELRSGEVGRARVEGLRG